MSIKVAWLTLKYIGILFVVWQDTAQRIYDDILTKNNFLQITDGIADSKARRQYRAKTLHKHSTHDARNDDDDEYLKKCKSGRVDRFF